MTTDNAQRSESIADRLDQAIDVTGMPVYEPERGGVTRYVSARSLTGMELAQRIATAKRLRAQLDQAIACMSQALDSGETDQERQSRTEREDHNPRDAASRMGWYLIEDFAELCDKGETGFYKRISSAKGEIVKPNAHKMTRLLGNEWAKYPQQGEYWGDHFTFADTWKDALQQARKERAKALEAQYA